MGKERSIDRKERTLGIKVIKTSASKLIRQLKMNDNFDPNHKIDQVGDYVIIPLCTKPQDNIEGEIGLFELPKTSNQPTSLKEAFLNRHPEFSPDKIQTSFDQIGDLAVIDLKEDMLTYKKDVGKSIISAHNNIKGVFRKKSKVKGKYRIRELEHLAGENRTRTVHREHGVEIHVDLSKVYFSPRLATEHNRIASQCHDGEVILDMFGALAPFALQICKHHESIVYSVDINPHTIPLIKKSISSNNLQGSVIPKTGDIRELSSEFINQGILFDRIIMNHPSNSLNYLNLAIKLLDARGKIYLYIFAPKDDPKKYCKNKLLAITNELTIVNVHRVRQSSPSEYQVCIKLQKIR